MRNFGFQFFKRQYYKKVIHNKIKSSLAVKYLLDSDLIVQLEEQKEQSQNLKEFQGLANNYTIKLDEKMELYQMYSFDIQISEKQIKKFIFIRLSKDNVVAFLDQCPHDKKSSLKDGFLMRNKIICPYHGCEYNIENGQVEKFPSFRNLVVYPVQIDEQQQQLNITIPIQLPLYQNQNYVTHDPDDYRKVIILGTGPAGVSAAITLRSFQYSGNIFMFTKDTFIPIQKQNLTKYTDYNEQNNTLEFLSKNVLKSLGINIIYGTAIEKADSDSTAISYVQHGKTKYIYDALIIATGPRTTSAFESDNISKNFIYLNNIYDYKKSARLVKTSNKILIIGLTEQSLELASTLKKQDKKKEIKLIDIGKNNLERIYQQKLYQELLEKFKEEGIEILMNYKLKEVKFMKDQNDFIEKVRLSKKENIYYPIDLIYKFQIGEDGISTWKKYTEFFFKSSNQSKINVDNCLQTFHENIFSAGIGARVMDPLTNERVEQTTWTDALEQGRIAALNLLGQRYDYRNISFGYYDYFDKSFQKVGQLSIANQDLQIGNVNELEFIKVYAKDNIITGCVSAGLKYNKIGLIIREALKQRRKLPLSDLQKDHNVFIQNLYLKLLKDPLSGTHFEKFYRRRFSPIKQFVPFKSDKFYQMHDLEAFTDTDELKAKFEKRLV